MVEHVRKIKDTLEEEPGFWEYLIMGITGC
jgi:hypothetical protein